MQEVFNRLLFCVGSEENKEKTQSVPACWQGGPSVDPNKRGRHWWETADLNKEKVSKHMILNKIGFVCKNLVTGYTGKEERDWRSWANTDTAQRCFPAVQGAVLPITHQAEHWAQASAAPQTQTVASQGYGNYKPNSSPLTFCLHLCAYSKADIVKGTCT